jgi:transcriptional regulator with XRE-family HTH domain
VSAHVVNWPRLVDAVEMACEIRDCSLRDVATATGISPSGLTRMRQGNALSADGLASLVAWLYPASIPTWIIPAPGREGGKQ